MGELFFYEQSGGFEGVILGHLSPSTAMGKASRNKAKKAEAARRRIVDMQKRREQVSQYRQQQIQQARVQNAAARTGVSDSSGVSGGVSSIGSTVASNFAFQNQVQSLQNDMAKNLDKAQQYKAYQNQMQVIGQAVASYFTGGMSSMGG